MKLYRNLQPSEHEPTFSHLTSLDTLLSTQTPEDFCDEDKDDLVNEQGDGVLSDEVKEIVYGFRVEEDISRIVDEDPEIARYEVPPLFPYFGSLYEDDESELIPPPKYLRREDEDVEYFPITTDGMEEEPELDEECEELPKAA